MKKHLIILCILPFLVFAESDEIYQQFTKGMPDFSYVVKQKNFKHEDGGIVSLLAVHFKSKKPHKTDKKENYYHKFSFYKRTYNINVAKRLFYTRKYRLIDNAIKNLQDVVPPCFYYKTRVNEVIYVLNAPCNFDWKIDIPIANMKQALNIQPTEEIICQFGGCEYKKY